MTNPKPNTPPTQPNQLLTAQQRQLDDIDSYNSLPEFNMINNSVFAGPNNPHPSSPTTPRATSPKNVQYDVSLIVPAYPTAVHHCEQPPVAMPEPISSYNYSNYPPSDDWALGLDMNLVGHGGGNGVTDWPSPSSVAGHHQSVFARPNCQPYGHPVCPSADRPALALSSLV